MTVREEAKAWTAKIAQGRNMGQEEKSKLEKLGFDLLEYNANNGGVLDDIMKGNGGIIKHDDDGDGSDEDDIPVGRIVECADKDEDGSGDEEDKLEDGEKEKDKMEQEKKDWVKKDEDKKDDLKENDSKENVNEEDIDKDDVDKENIDQEDVDQEDAEEDVGTREGLNGVVLLVNQRPSKNKAMWLGKLLRYAAGKHENDDEDSELEFSDFEDGEIVIKKEKVKTKGLIEPNKDSHLLHEKSRGWVKKQKRGRRG